MSTISQRIPNLLLGVSQQPDKLKFPGQVKQATNVFPDYALGLLKRPGGKFEAELYNAEARGRWFPILRDEEEKYVCQYDTTDGQFRIWSLIDGQPRAVDMGTTAATGQPSGCNITNLKSDLDVYNTAQDDTDTKLNDLNSKQATYTKTNDGQTATKVNLFDVDVTYKNGYYEESLKSGVLERIDNGQRIVKDDGTNAGSIAAGSAMPSGYSLGNERTDDYPWFKRDGYRVYEVEKEVAAAYNSTELSTANTNMGTAQTAYDNAVSTESTEKGDYDSEVTACNIGSSNIPASAYLKDAAPEDIEILTINDYTFVLNKNKTTAMKTTTSAAVPNVAFVVIRIVAYNSDYSVTLNGTTVTHSTPDTVAGATTDSGSIAAALTSSINALTGFSATQVGPGIYIEGTSAFSISTSGSTTEEGIFAFQDQINVASRLPNQCENGYRVRVTNSGDVTADDIYVEFQTTNSAARGPGVWEETIGPSLEFEIDETTMPHQLIRQANGVFKYEPVTWDDRLVGDNTTNPIPSFIGKKINNMFFYRNRLGLLSNEAVIMSRAGDYFNFFANSSQVVAPDDPIDLQATSVKPVTLNYTLATSIGLLVFGPNEQFVLSTDADILSPTTTKINTISTFECDAEIDAVAVGTTQAFISKSNLYSKLFLMLNVQKEAAATIDEATTNVPEYVPSDIDSMTASPAMSIVSLGKSGSNTVYQHRFFMQGENRVQTWYKWQLTGDLRLQFFDKTTFYAVTSSGSNVYLTSYDLTQASESGYLTLPTGEKTDVCLDMFNVNPYRTYSTSTKKTTVNLPFDHITGKKLAVVAIGTYIGDTISATSESEGSVFYFEDSDISSNQVLLNGDYRGRDLIIGYVYDMELELPTLYPTQVEGRSSVSDVTSDLILHRLKVSTGLSGPITYKVDITGKDEWTNIINVTLPNTYVLNNVNLSASALHDVPIYQRNENVNIKIIGDTPFPISLLNIVWEGNYNRRFYRRS
ncbi:tail protein [Synechococcus phage S-RIP2]|uniref:Tail tubular protein B n=2 Tax=Sednavirus SRIP2 TaxID=2733955 RepID=M4NNS7_9CAUD|nr:tail protein [Synechococcus phage S-RIP2]AGG91311.1 hypothetical protein SWQG_00014 [Synechococcus phage S-RIP2]